VYAQNLPPFTADDQMGLQPYQSYHGGDIDHIGLANGTLNLDFPFLTYPQRGSLHLDFHLYYNNQPQHVGQYCVPGQGGQCRGLWGYTPAPGLLPLDKGDVFVGWAQQMALAGTGASTVFNSGKSDQYTYYYERWSVQTADGATHPLGNLGTQTLVPNCPPGCTYPNYYTVGSGPWETLDATGFRVNGALTTLWPELSGSASANTVVGPGGVVGGTEDPNGNVISTTANGFGIATAFTDTLGRQITAPPTSSSASNTGTTNCPTGGLPVDHAVLWSVPGPNGGTSNYTFCYVKVAVNIPPGPGSIEGKTGTATNLQSIVLPDGHSWNFQYNDPGDGSTYNNAPVNYGTLTQVTLPTGGTLAYAYNTRFGSAGVAGGG
jgi:hypothetical protein